MDAYLLYYAQNSHTDYTPTHGRGYGRMGLPEVQAPGCGAAIWWRARMRQSIIAAISRAAI